jgi:hypothetical protein
MSNWLQDDKSQGNKRARSKGNNYSEIITSAESRQDTALSCEYCGNSAQYGKASKASKRVGTTSKRVGEKKYFRYASQQETALSCANIAEIQRKMAKQEQSWHNKYKSWMVWIVKAV